MYTTNREIPILLSKGWRLLVWLTTENTIAVVYKYTNLGILIMVIG